MDRDRESKPQRERGSEGMEHLWCLGPLLCKGVTWVEVGVVLSPPSLSVVPCGIRAPVS